jgi:predicted Zn-dependent protease
VLIEALVPPYTTGSGMVVDTGSGDTVSGVGETVNVGANLAAGTLLGSTEISGSNATINAGSSVAVSVVGQNQTIQGVYDTIYLGANTSANVIGAGMDIDTNVNDQITSTQAVISVAGDLPEGYSAGVTTIYGSGNFIETTGQTIDLGNSASAGYNQIYGNYNLVNVANSNVVAVTGWGDELTGNADLVEVGYGSYVAEVGADDTINTSAADLISAAVGSRVNVGASFAGGYAWSDTNVNGTYEGEGEDLGIDANGTPYLLGGGYGFAGNAKTVSAALGSDIGSVAQYDLAQGDMAGAVAAQTAQQQAQQMAAETPTSGSGTSVLTGSQWAAGEVVTWSLADPSSSTALGSTYESDVAQAFATWAAVSGISFEEVSGATPADIQLNFADLNTATSGVVGYTSTQSANGLFTGNTTIQLEAPTQDALVAGADGQSVYAGTDATLEQVALHEIGHALGLADNSDQNSIMYYELTSNNPTLDATDIAGIQSRYGGAGVTASAPAVFNAASASASDPRLERLVAGMATFNADGGGETSLAHTAADHHHHAMLSVASH